MTELNSTQKEKLMSDLRVVISDAEELLRMTADQAGESVAGVRARMQDRLKQANAELHRLQDLTVAQVKAVGNATDEFVHENPWKSVGVAAGIGLLVGLLIGRR